MTGYRLPAGGSLLDRSRHLRFTFDGRGHDGLAGDTLASALLAGGQRLVGRSFKYHRPRGLVGSGAEEPNALVTLHGGDRAEPNTRATLVELSDGLVAASQNRWPSLRLDLMSLAGLASPLLGAGFYYKTFMGPGRRAWPFWERLIRRAAGLGRASPAPDPDAYEKCHAFCDVLVVGGGRSGLAAAREAAALGKRVILAEERWWLGGLDPAPAPPGVTTMLRTAVWGYYDDNTLAAIEHCDGRPAQRYWEIRAGRVVLATGAVERPVVFAGNDRPGVMLLDAVRRYARLWGVAAGRRVAIFTNNDGAYEAVADLLGLGVNVVAVIDARRDPPPVAQTLAGRGIELRTATVVARALGGQALRAIELAPWDTGRGEPMPGRSRIEVDVLAVSGGWSPQIQLASQAGGPPIWDESLAAFLPGRATQDWQAVGACAGRLDAGRVLPIREVPGRGRKLVDLQNDVTAADVRLARREGFESVEHLKRYTTLGMATDQGRTSSVNGIAIMAGLRGLGMAEAGTTRFRPPAAPVTLGALAGGAVGVHHQPTRLTPMHDWHLANGGEMQAAGLWLRPRAYLRPGETVARAYVREARTVREKVGIVDVSTLGKIEVQGPDAATFLDRVYVNTFSTLPVGKARYGVMLRDDGFVLDDGTCWRLSPGRFLMTTSTAQAAAVLSHLEMLLAVAWPELRVQLVSVTDQWAAMAVAGPRSRDVLAAALDDFDTALPFMGVQMLGDSLIGRVSFSGERAYEVFCPADQGEATWRRLIEAGRPHGMVPYGVEALGALRIEKGHVAGGEIDGRTTLDDLGLGRMASTSKAFVGRAMMRRPGLVDPDRPKLVGLVSRDGQPVRAGSHLVASADPGAPGPSLGHVTSWTFSPALDRYIALALLRRGRDQIWRELFATYPLKGWHVPVEVVPPCMVDAEGARLHG
ncbi:MAG TPA: 2Fe-2S iron-sulfur cluster-binding protein [Geminicoccaceae bacterium]|nr:2Fe-2S iron-sulfur cluster-binding protein [Geminicoccus sp.]HMU50003.1 2Fe-2S iron-sulfur cluster-binding protein [Geminicoccaceae bacterium]